MQGPSEPITDFVFGGGTEVFFKDLPGFAVIGDVMFAKQMEGIYPRIVVGARYYFW
jgi:hypothetical protein